MIKIRTLCLILLCLLTPVVQAIKVPGLYAAEVVVADQSEAARNVGIQTAFRMVLIKLTGDRMAPGRTALAPLMEQARNYMQQYRYREVPLARETAPAEVVNKKETRLWVKFYEDKLNQALRDLSVPLWGKERPSTLLWLAVGDGQGRRLVSLENGAEYIQTIEQRAAQRGITFIYPLLDLDDSSALRASDIWGAFRQPVVDASIRYHADAILTAAIESPVPGIWEGHWTTYIDNQIVSWSNEADSLAALLEEGIDNLADTLASHFVQPDAFVGVNDVRLSVVDIFNTDQYARVLAYLSSLNSVADVEVMQVEKGKVTFKLIAHGGELTISQAIALGRVLEPISRNSDDYRLLP